MTGTACALRWGNAPITSPDCRMVPARPRLIPAHSRAATQFYTQLKTVTSLWRAEDATELKAATQFPRVN